MSLTAVSTFECLGLYWTPPAPPSSDCPVQYRQIGVAAWKDALPAWYDARNNEVRGSIVHLQPGTSYQVRIGLTAGNWLETITASTWSEDLPIGETVTVGDGTTALNISSGGTADAYKLYTPAPGQTATIDGQNAIAQCIHITAPYVILRGLKLLNAQAFGILIENGAHHLIIEDCEIAGWGRYRTTDVEGDHGMLDAAIYARNSLSITNIVIQRCLIRDPRYNTNSWSQYHPTGPLGINMELCGGNHVIRYNEIDANKDGRGMYYMDAIGGGENFSFEGFPFYDSDIHGNICKHCWDDGIEAEGGNRNVRIWGNYLDECDIGIASTVTSIGPLYIWRNVFNRSRERKMWPRDEDQRNCFFKAGSQTDGTGYGRRYLFHNTSLQATESGSQYPLGTGGAANNAAPQHELSDTVSRNNIFQIWKPWWATFAGTIVRCDFDYDLYNGELGDAVGQEVHGIHGTPIYAAGNGWQAEATGKYRLAPGSPGFEQGSILPNFNDGFTGNAPDMGAHESGTPDMGFGPNAVASQVSGVVGEGASAAVAADAPTAYVAIVSEAGSAQVTASAPMNYPAAQAETGAATDGVNGALPGDPLTLADELTETATPVEAVATLVNAEGQVVEAVNAADAASATRIVAPTTAPSQLPTPDQTVIKTSERLWSEELALALANDALGTDSPGAAYVFGNGRRFVDGDLYG